MKKSSWFMLLLAALLLVGCSNTKNENDGLQPISPSEPMENPASSDEDANINSSTSDEAGSSTQTTPEASIEDLQKQMALKTLNGIAKDAKQGKVYRPDNGFLIGKTERDAVHKTIGEPEEKEGGYEHYHGSMGNPSVAFKYDGNGILEEARYFGTNVERQTNLGGITGKDLIEQLGKPLETREVTATGEKNILYHMEDFELQFIFNKNGELDHVNLKYKE